MVTNGSVNTAMLLKIKENPIMAESLKKKELKS